LRLGDLTLRKWHYQTGLPSLVNCESCQLQALSSRLPAAPMTATINRDMASNPDEAPGVIPKRACDRLAAGAALIVRVHE
jgi:hypothetical protein